MEPKNRISDNALKVWRITGFFTSLFGWVITIAVAVLTYFFDWPNLIWAALVIMSIAHTYLFIFLIPSIRWKRWRYEVRESEIEIQSGLIIIKRTLVPMSRVQHVDTKQGPVLRRYDLATVVVSTAATSHEIPALDTAEADDIRYFISTLAKVEEEDV
ncbi:PH domain-containing protein [Peribacillus saganii]|uniref:PH domain-containing protein n=1 Tax=Peribacillus saganii TaxID=2303992 RepID=UPI001F3B50BE|nr:PH domain-containing protein [Peribacillus saganii]